MIRLPNMKPQRCYVCGGRATHMHEGRFYCVRNACQTVAAGMVTLRAARRDLRARGYVIA